MTIVSNYTAILAINDEPNARWNVGTPTGTGAVVTYSFLSGQHLPGRDALFYGATGASALTSAQRDSFEQALDAYSAVTGLVFVEVPAGVDANIEVFRANGMGSVVGYAHYPEAERGSTSSGDLALGMTGNWAPGTWQFTALLHELGHAVGLQHPFDGSFTLPAALDNHNHTLQSYTFTAPYAFELPHFDEDAVQFLYGAGGASGADWTGDWNPRLGRLEVTLSVANDRIITTEIDSFVNAGAGNDLVYGRDGNDSLLGWAGNDRIQGGDGRDRVWGHSGRDNLRGNDGNDWLNGGNGFDTLFGNNDNDTLAGGAGNDRLYGGTGRDKLFGNDGNDRLYGQQGDDYIRGWTGHDLIVASTGNDVVMADSGRDTVYGGNGRDRINGGQGDDRIYGGAGADFLNGNQGVDRMFGGNHGDRMTGGWGNDVLFGEAGADRLVGGTGHDTLWGNQHDDSLYGQGGNDLLDGGIGDDVMMGGAGVDEFRFNRGSDRIYDWRPGETIRIDTRYLDLAGETVNSLLADATVSNGHTILHFGNGHQLMIAGVDNPGDLSGDLILV